MEWRCEWCGKPHAENDPPCDECGHGQFERAVVPVAPEGEGGPTVWVCTECGRTHPRNNPPCSRCGAMTLEKREQSAEDAGTLDADVNGVRDGDEDSGGLWRRLTGGGDDDPGGPDTMTVWACTECGRAHPKNNPPCSRCGGMTFEREERDFEDVDENDPGSAAGSEGSGDGDRYGTDGTTDQTHAASVAGDTTTLWVCTECGRTHPRNNPPCSRCGGMSFERREERFEDLGPATSGWLGALDLKLALGFVGAAALLALLVGSALGIITLPGQVPPTIPADDVPGEAGAAAGLDLATVEAEYVAALNDRRAGADLTSLGRNEDLDARATWYNRRVVQSVYGEAGPPSEAELDDAFRGSGCGDRPSHATARVGDVGSFGSEAALAAALVDEQVSENGLTSATDGLVGVDVHVGPDGDVFVTQFVC